MSGKSAAKVDILVREPSPPFVRSAYNYDVKAVSDETGLVCPEPTLAQQQFKDNANVNMIVETYARTQDDSLLQVSQPVYGDFSDSVDFYEAHRRVIQAQNDFNNLDARIRRRFDNDPGQLLDFVSNPDNRDEAVSLGLIVPPKEEPPKGEPFAQPQGKNGKPVGGSGQKPKAAVRPSNSIPDGYKLVPVGGDEEGD